MTDIIYRQENYDIVGCLYEVFKCLGNGLSERVYKDDLEYEFIDRNIPFEREKQFSIMYKDFILKHKFYADFAVFNNVILEIKAVEILTDQHLGQCINYLKVSKNKLAILANYKGVCLEYKRVFL